MKAEPWWCSVVLKSDGKVLLFINDRDRYDDLLLPDADEKLVAPTGRHLRLRYRARHVIHRNAVAILTAGKVERVGINDPPDWPWHHVGYYKGEEAKEMLMTYARMLEGQ